MIVSTVFILSEALYLILMYQWGVELARYRAYLKKEKKGIAL